MEEKSTYTTGEIAKSIGYTAQSIRNAIRELDYKPAGMSGRKALYTVDQAEAIAKHFGKEFVPQKQTDRQKLSPIEEKEDQIVFLKGQLASRDADIAEKNEQIKRKDEQISTLLESLSITQSQLSTAQNQLADAQSSIKVLSGSVAAHTIADNADKLLVKDEQNEEKDEVDAQNQEQSMTRWEHFKAAFRRKKKG